MDIVCVLQKNDIFQLDRGDGGGVGQNFKSESSAAVYCTYCELPQSIVQFL